MTEAPYKLAERRCVPCEGDAKPLSAAQCRALKKHLREEWLLDASAKKLVATFEFKNYFRTLAFVNAVAYIAISEDHHPDIAFGYKTCAITYSTHNIGGLSENDFICAAKVDALLN